MLYVTPFTYETHNKHSRNGGVEISLTSNAILRNKKEGSFAAHYEQQFKYTTSCNDIYTSMITKVVK